jgi:sterol desaturase/sphingolipid hydroxylase (fatty acid hydroxylase superfamily)
MSGGACFTPRLAQRPAYPPAGAVLRHTLLSYVRVPVLCALLALGCEGAFRRGVGAALAAGWSERWVFVMMTFLVHTGCYVGINGFFFLCAKRGWLREYQLDRKPYQIPGDALLRRTFWEAFVSQCVTTPVGMYFLFPVFRYFGMPRLLAPLPPSFARLCVGFATAHLVNDVGFYWSHRTVHHPSLYKHIHKQHHTYTGSIGIAAEYASPIESIVSNALPTIGGMLFFGCHGSGLLYFVWLAVRLQQTYEAHSGYCFYDTALYKVFGMTNADACAYHDYHHSGNRGNFGAMWLDWLCGTMDAWIDLGGTVGYIELCRKNVARAAGAEKESVSEGHEDAKKTR